MTVETVNIPLQPVFDPTRVGASLDVLGNQLPLSKLYLNGSVIGDILSRRKGEGVDFDGVRDYEDGDDVRDIDWNATASDPTDQLQVREHFQDITPAFTAVTDMLQRRHQVNPGYFSEQNLALSAILGLAQLANIHGMPIKLIGGNDETIAVKQRQAANGRRYMLQLAHQLANNISDRAVQPNSERPNLAEVLSFAGKNCTEQVVVIVSDFRDVADPSGPHGWNQPLQRLRAQQNDMIAVELTNVFDYRLPAKADRVGRRWVNQHDRQRYAANATQQQTAIDFAIAKSGARHIKLSTADPQWATSLADQLRA